MRHKKMMAGCGQSDKIAVPGVRSALTKLEKQIEEARKRNRTLGGNWSAREAGYLDDSINHKLFAFEISGGEKGILSLQS